MELDIMNSLIEDAKALTEINKQFRKKFNETYKLKQHGALSSKDSLVFIRNCQFKDDFMCTYIRGYDGIMDQFQFHSLNNLVNPDIYKNGVIVFSAYETGSPNKIISSPESSLNFTEASVESLDTSEPNASSQFFHEVYIEDYDVFYCGNSELFATDFSIGGSAPFYGRLGLSKKILVFLDGLIPLSIVEAKYLEAVYIQVLGQIDVGDAPTFLVNTNLKKNYRHISKRLVFPEVKGGEKVLHIVSQMQDETMPSKKEEKGTSTFFATYDIFQDLYNDDVKEMGETSLKIDFHWSGIGYQRMQPPPHSAIPIIRLQLAVGESRSAANDLYLELKRLDAIVETENTPRLLHSYQFSSEVLDKLSSFKDYVASSSYSGSGERAESVEGVEGIDKPIMQLQAEALEYKDMDFTDQLWAFIKDLEHVDAIHVLDDILYDITSGALQPAVNPHNETKLAKCIRKLYLATDEMAKSEAKEKISELISNDQATITVIGEIGFEKLRKQYFNFFLNQELTSRSALQRLCPRVCGHFDIAALWKLHYCLEIVITPAMYLKLTLDCQITLLNAAMNYYTDHDVTSMSPMFALSLLPFQEASTFLKAACESRQPIVWQHAKCRSNHAMLNEALVARVKVTSADVDFNNSDNVPYSQEETILLREQTLYLPGGICKVRIGWHRMSHEKLPFYCLGVFGWRGGQIRRSNSAPSL